MVRLPTYLLPLCIFVSCEEKADRQEGFCGVMSIFSSMRYCLGPSSAYGTLLAALALIPLGLFFDFMDGKVARWRKKSSLMGQELDSLADLVRPLSFIFLLILLTSCDVFTNEVKGVFWCCARSCGLCHRHADSS